MSSMWGRGRGSVQVGGKGQVAGGLAGVRAAPVAGGVVCVLVVGCFDAPHPASPVFCLS